MYAVDHSRRALVDGALPLLVLLSGALALSPLAVSAVAVLYLVFAAGIASNGAERPGEPLRAWQLYAAGMGALAAGVPFGRWFALPGLVLFLAGFAVHLRVKAGHGVCRIGVLSACGRRSHDARVGRTLEATALVLAAAVALSVPALFAVAGWLVTAAAVAERADPGSLAQPATSTVT